MSQLAGSAFCELESDFSLLVSILPILPIRSVLFSFLDTINANSLRATCRYVKEAVTDFRWKDMNTVIRGSIKSWRSCFQKLSVRM